ncbi:MAG TPA: aldo/keto reductase, partial [Bacteroidota bacterium]
HRLNTDRIDLYQFHWPDPGTPVEDSWNTMANLQREGKVRYIGVSNFSVGELERCRSVAPVQSLQPPYNMLNREVENELLPYCSKQGIGVVAYSPMASGMLTEKFDFDKLAPDDWRRKSPRFNPQSRSKVSRLLEELRPVADRNGLSIGELAVAWVLRNESVTAAIVGARKSWQIEETVGGAEVGLSDSDADAIGRILQNL